MYITTQIVKAVPMTAYEYQISQGYEGCEPEDTLPLETIVKAKSLPDAFKDKVLENPNTESVKFGAYICMKCADGSICNGWLASQTDMLSNDWMLVLTKDHE
ncbi:MW1434 family type I TA system toxin [Parabacteroides sp.]|uniref:Thoeris anti-defense Tad2 family protein n=1 Tax=Parabacteroides sp. TaxID=1869337 RepID=UPI00290D472A|nr:MW1434 family type I TA system toxin [Parabacteroides sp.]MDU7627635.1 DUF2829 domain-containing protein [Parabacteroides sp.]